MSERDELIAAFPEAFTDPPSPSASFSYLIDRIKQSEDTLKKNYREAVDYSAKKSVWMDIAVELLTLADKLPADYHRGAMALIREYLK